MNAAIICRLFLVGGRAATCVADFPTLAGGVEANIVVLPHASDYQVEVAQEMLEALQKLGARNVRVVRHGDKLSLDGVDAVPIQGGDQSSLVDRLGRGWCCRTEAGIHFLPECSWLILLLVPMCIGEFINCRAALSATAHRVRRR